MRRSGGVDPGSAASSGAIPGKPRWTVPAGWQEIGPGAMQLARYVAGAEGARAEISVAVLPGEGGGWLANANRWRGQIGLPAIEQAGLEQVRVPLSIQGAQAFVVDFVAEATQRRLVAAGVTRGGQTWFYKLTGDAVAVGGQKDAFLGFVQSAAYEP